MSPFGDMRIGYGHRLNPGAMINVFSDEECEKFFKDDFDAAKYLV